MLMRMAKALTYRNFVFINFANLNGEIKPELEIVVVACEKIIQLIDKELAL